MKNAKNFPKNLPENFPKNQEWKMKDVLNVLSAVMFSSLIIMSGYVWYNSLKKEDEVVKDGEPIPRTKTKYPAITTIRGNIVEWQNYANAVAIAVCDDCNAKEKKDFAEVFLALLAHESGYQSQAVSRTGAQGLGQITEVVDVDFRLPNRSPLYWRQVLHIRQKYPKLLTILPIDLQKVIQKFPENPSHRDIAELASAFDFYARSAPLQAKDAKLDPYANILLSAMIFRLKYNEWKTARTGAKDNKIRSEESFSVLQTRLKGTKYDLPKDVNFWKNTKKMLHALRSYNGDVNKKTPHWPQERDVYVYAVLEDYKNKFAETLAQKYRTKSKKKLEHPHEK